MTTKAAKQLINDYHLLSYDVLDSTNEEARRLAGGGGAHGAVVWAKRQTAGRGREGMGREWFLAEGNLFVSVLLSPECDLATASQLSFVAALAVAETLEAIVDSPKDIACKWPNDAVQRPENRRHSAGIPHHQRGGWKQQKLGHCAGVGINIDSYPEHVMFPATSLREAGVELISAKIVLSRFIHNFLTRYDAWEAKGFSSIEDGWMQHVY